MLVAMVSLCAVALSPLWALCPRLSGVTVVVSLSCLQTLMLWLALWCISIHLVGSICMWPVVTAVEPRLGGGGGVCFCSGASRSAWT
jgi:hypothetical protein